MRIRLGQEKPWDGRGKKFWELFGDLIGSSI